MNSFKDIGVDDSSPTQQTQAERRALAENSLLNAAIKLIGERGIDRLTMAEVGLEAGYSSGLAAHYFGKKEELVGAVARHIIEKFRRMLEQHLLLQPGLDGLLTTVSLYFDSATSAQTGVRTLFVLMGSALNRPELSADMASVNRLGVEELERQIRYGVEQGRIRADIDARSEAALILATLRGTVSLWLLDPDNVRLEELRDVYVANLQRSLSV